MINKKTRDLYSLELIRTGIFLLRVVSVRPIRGYYPYDALRALLFYTYEEAGEHILPLNREYKPLGLSGYGITAKYDEYPFLYIPKNIVNFDALEKKKYLFHDGTYPSNAKSKKIYISQVADFFNNEIDFIYREGHAF